MRNERSVDGADEVVLVGVWPQDRDRAMQVFGEMQAPLRDDPECNREGRTTSREAPDVVDPGFAFLTVDESHDSPAASTEDAQGDPERRSHLRAYTWVSAHDTADPAAGSMVTVWLSRGDGSDPDPQDLKKLMDAQVGTVERQAG